MSENAEPKNAPVHTQSLDLSPEDALQQMRNVLVPEEGGEVENNISPSSEEFPDVPEDDVTPVDEEFPDEIEEEEPADEEFPDEPEEESEEEPTEEESEVEDDLSDDLDDPLEEEELEEEGGPEDEDELEEKETIITQVRKLSKVNKELTDEVDLLNEQMVSKDSEIGDLRDQLDKMSATRVDPTSHPDFIEVRGRTHNSLASQLRRAVGTSMAKEIVGTEESPKWGKILTETANLDSVPFDEQEGVENNLRLYVAQRLGFQGDELDEDMDHDYIENANKVINTFGDYTSNYNELADIHSTIVSKSETKSLEVGRKDYLQKTENVRKGLAVIGTMSEKEIAEDPDSLQALAAYQIQKSPQAKTRFDKINKLVVEMAYGPESLSQEELDRHKATGKDMAEFHKSREKRVENFRKERLPEIAAALLLWPDIKKILPAHFKDASDKESREARKKVVSGSKSAKPTKPKKKVSDEEKSVEEHVSSIHEALNLG